MKKHLLLILLAVTLTSCPHDEPDAGSGTITIVKFKQKEYSKYVLGYQTREGAVQTNGSYIQTITPKISLVELADGWWYFNGTNVLWGRHAVLGDKTWKEYNALYEKGEDPVVSALKDSCPIVDMTDIELSEEIGLSDTCRYPVYDASNQNDTTSIVVRLREIISSGQLDKYRDDFRLKRYGNRM